MKMCLQIQAVILFTARRSAIFRLNIGNGCHRRAVYLYLCQLSKISRTSLHPATQVSDFIQAYRLLSLLAVVQVFDRPSLQ